MRIYLFSPIRYDFLHQRPQQLANRFRSMNIPVTFVQPSGFKEYLSGNRPGLWKVILVSLWYHLLGSIALIFPSAITQTPRRVFPTEQFEILSLPVTFPVNRVNSQFLEMLTSAIYRQFLLREVFHADEKSAGIFIDPFWGNVVHKGDTEIVCYDCIDDISLYVGYASRERFAEYETRLLGMADVIISTSRKLQEQLQRKTSKHVRRIPNGVDVDWFQQHSSAAVPDDLQRIAGPVVGYVGYLAGWTDYELIHEVAALLPEVSFVFIGPLEHEERAGQLQREKNIYWLGKKPYEEIPACIQRFNVCIIPFVAGGIAETTNPVKIFEYFALGKPVVSTPLNELQSYVDEGVMTFAATPASFAEALRKALVEENNGLASQRKAIAGKNSWHSHAQSFVDAFNQAAKK